MVGENKNRSHETHEGSDPIEVSGEQIETGSVLGEESGWEENELEEYAAPAEVEVDLTGELNFSPSSEASAPDLGELEDYAKAEIEERETIADERLDSILEGIFFASDRPVSFVALKTSFKGTDVSNDRLRRALDRLATELAGARRGVALEEVGGGYQLRTKIDILQFLKRSLKGRSFRLSGPALEVMAIVAYKQPVIKSEIDEIRGVESGHLLRALMEKNLVQFAGRAESVLGKPMQYASTRKFLEIFGLRNIRELPTLSQIDELLPEGMNAEDEVKNSKLSELTEPLSQSVGTSYSEGEEELQKVAGQLENISTTTEFFEAEKLEQEKRQAAERAQRIREMINENGEVSTRDRNWLQRYEDQANCENS